MDVPAAEGREVIGNRVFDYRPQAGQDVQSCGSDIKPKMNHIALLDEVFLALQAGFAGLLGPLLATEGNEVVE